MEKTKAEHREIIAKFLEEWKHLPEQGSEQWVADRPLKVGGSELHSVQKNMAQVVALKIGLKQIPTVLAMVWGNTFEPVIRNICSIITGTSIQEAGSIPSAEVPLYKNYSMDGMGTVVFRDTNGKPVRRITLFEFKCLYSRKPVPGEIPQTYQPQIKSGLCDLSIAEMGLFVEGVFRLCSAEQLGYGPERNTTLLPKDWVSKDTTPFAYGIVGVYADNLHLDNPFAIDYITNRISSERVPDYGRECDYSVLEYIMKCLREKRFQSWYSRICFDGDAASRCTPVIDLHRFRKPQLQVDTQSELQNFVQWCKQEGKILIGILPWKIFHLNMVTVEKEPGYTLSHEPLLRECITHVRELLDIKDLAERYAEYNRRFYPPSKEEQALQNTRMAAMANIAPPSDSESDSESELEPDSESDSESDSEDEDPIADKRDPQDIITILPIKKIMITEVTEASEVDGSTRSS